MGLIRQLHWDTLAFHDFLAARKLAPFAWGQNDCALFAADGIEAITGVDIAAEFRGRYKDEAGAFAAIRLICGGSAVADAAAYCARKYEMPELTHPLKAQRGDLAVFCAPTGAMIAGLIDLSGAHLISVGESGLFRFPITKILRAWRCG